MISGRQNGEGRNSSASRSSSWRAAKVEAVTIISAEVEHREPSITMAQTAKIEGVLAKAGVEFIPENGGGDGVRLRKQAE